MENFQSNVVLVFNKYKIIGLKADACVFKNQETSPDVFVKDLYLIQISCPAQNLFRSNEYINMDSFFVIVHLLGHQKYFKSSFESF